VRAGEVTRQRAMAVRSRGLLRVAIPVEEDGHCKTCANSASLARIEEAAQPMKRIPGPFPGHAHDPDAANLSMAVSVTEAQDGRAALRPARR
jgi:hypothetical protein